MRSLQTSVLLLVFGLTATAEARTGLLLEPPQQQSQQDRLDRLRQLRAERSQPNETAKPTPATLRKLDGRALRNVRADRVSLSDLRTGSLSALSPTEKLTVLAGMPNRYGATANPSSSGSGAGPVTRPVVSGQAANGVHYSMGRATPNLPAPQSGNTTTQRQQNDLIVCRETPLELIKQFVGPLMIVGLPSSQNQSVIYPGALFRDQDVVRGTFTPLNLPRRPGSLTIDVFNPGGPVAQSIGNLNDRTQVVTAINQLRSGTAQAQALTYLEYLEAAFQANTQLSLAFEMSADANIEALTGAPLTLGGGASAGLGFESGVNVAVATLNQVYYTISLGGEGPASTIQGDIPPDAVCITDVQYGRRAFLMVGSVFSRAEAQAALGDLLAFAPGGVDIVSAERNLSASARRALEAGFVRVTLVGGNVQRAVTVRDLASLRGYIEQIDPSVGGANAVPIAYTLRYAADNAPAKVGAFTSLVDRECFRASQLRVTLVSLKPTKVVDWGDEELFGTIRASGAGTVASGSATLWNRGINNWIAGRENVTIPINQAVTYNFNAGVTAQDTVEVRIDIRDKIMPLPDPEWVGANESDRQRGYAQYGVRTERVSLTDVRNAPNGRLNRTVTVSEGDARVEVALRFELL